MHGFAAYEDVEQCNMCGAAGGRALPGRAHIWRCPSCHHQYLKRRPTQAAIIESYDSQNTTHAVWQAQRAGREVMWAKRAARVAELAPGGGTALDVGAGFGDFPRHLRETGSWAVEGTEVSENAVAYAKENHDLHLHLGQLEDCDLPAETYDLITMWHVLEHVPHPGATLDRLVTLLRPGGRLVVAVPNDGIWPRLLFLFARDAIKWPVVKALGRPYRPGVDAFFGAPKFGEEIHLSFFEPHRLAAAMQERGLTPVEVGVDDLYSQPSNKTSVAHAAFDTINRRTGTNLSRATLVVAQKPAAPTA